MGGLAGAGTAILIGLGCLAVPESWQPRFFTIPVFRLVGLLVLSAVVVWFVAGLVLVVVRPIPKHLSRARAWLVGLPTAFLTIVIRWALKSATIRAGVGADPHFTSEIGGNEDSVVGATPISGSDLVTAYQAAALLDVPVRQFEILVQTGQIPSRLVRSEPRFTLRDLFAYVRHERASNTSAGGPAVPFDVSVEPNSRGLESVKTTEKSIGELLRRVRESRGVSQQIMATRLGVTQASVSRFEHADDSITVATLKKYLDELGYRLDLHSVPQRSE